MRLLIMHIRSLQTMDIKLIFGQNLQRIRHEKGLSQEELARLAGCARAYLSGAEAGRRNATIETIDALANVLGVKAHELLRPAAI